MQLTPLAALVLLSVATLPCLAQTRFHEYTKRFKEPARPVQVLQTSYLGGSGSEWLSGGGFLKDGRIFLAGSAVGPTFDLNKTKAQILGQDQQPPKGLEDPKAITERIEQEYAATLAKWEQDGKKGRQPQKGRYQAPELWKLPEATGFALLLDKDGKRIEALCRLAWRSGGITSACVGLENELYVAGTLGPNGATLNAEHIPLKPESYQGTAEVPVNFNFDTKIFVGRLKADLSGFVWVKTLDEFALMDPQIEVRDDGLLHLEVGHRYLFESDGKLVHPLKTWIVNKWARGVDPYRGATAVGSDNMTGTGREPWRQPTMVMVRENGTQYKLYAWSGALVGIDSIRLVSDSSLRKFTFTREGTVYLYGWSDGGNTVLSYNPFDLRQGTPHKGLGMSMWGANATSGCHLVHIDPESGEVLGQTLWMGYLTKKNQPSGMGIDSMRAIGSHSLLLTGGCGWGIIQTGDNLWPSEKWETVRGSLLAVMTSDLSDLRFSSGMLACAEYKIGRNRTWGLSDRVVNGRHLALAVTGAVENQQLDDQYFPAPARNPIQANFGGGVLDGHFTILDLSTTPQK